MPRLFRRYPLATFAVTLLLATAVAAAWFVAPGATGGSAGSITATDLTGDSSPTAPASSLRPATTLVASLDASPGTVLMGAGDICISANIANARLTAALLQAEPVARVFTLGDNSNEEGTVANYRDCYAPTWGAEKDRTSPTPGNHDQYTAHGAAYYAYFGAAAGPARKGYYSYDLEFGWHVVVLNSICDEVGGCEKGSTEEKWLQADLAASAGKHTVAMWHVPEFSSGGHGNTGVYRAWWDDLYAAHAEIVLSGHDHDYERFARQSPAGDADPAGIRQFVVGTGGASHTPIFGVRANSEIRNWSTFGVLKLTLRAHSYDWQFVPVSGGKFTDTGETATHF